MGKVTSVTTATMRSNDEVGGLSARLRNVSFGSRSDLREAGLGEVEVPTHENVWVSLSGCEGVPAGFVDVDHYVAQLPLCFRPSGARVFLRRHSEEDQAVQSAFGALHGVDVTENGVARAFVKGESRETFDALVTLVKCRLLDVCRNPLETAPSAAGARMSLLHEMARFGAEPLAAQHESSQEAGISLTERFEALRDVGVDLDWRETASGNLSPLHAAARRNNWQVVKALLLNGADPNLPSGHGATPLMLAAEKSALNAMHELLTVESASDKADPNLRGYAATLPNDAVAPLHLAVGKRVGGLAGVRKLLANGADVMQQTAVSGWTPFHYAVLSHQFENAKALLDKGADPNVTDHAGNTALHIACNRRDGEAVMQLLEFGADPNRDNASHQKPLYVAIRNFNDLDVIKKLLDCGAHVNADNRVMRDPVQSYYGWTALSLYRPALHLVCDYDFSAVPRNLDFDYLARVGRLLLERGADPEQRDLHTGDTALHTAARRANQQMVQLLVEVGNARLDERNYKGRRPIDLAGRSGFGNIFSYLKDKGAKGPYRFNSKESYGVGGGGA